MIMYLCNFDHWFVVCSIISMLVQPIALYYDDWCNMIYLSYATDFGSLYMGLQTKYNYYISPFRRDPCDSVSAIIEQFLGQLLLFLALASSQKLDKYKGVGVLFGCFPIIREQ